MKQLDIDSRMSPKNGADTDDIFISTPNMVLHFPSPRVRRRHLSKISEERDDVTVKAQQQVDEDDEQVRVHSLVRTSNNNNRAKNCKTNESLTFVTDILSILCIVTEMVCRKSC